MVIWVKAGLEQNLNFPKQYYTTLLFFTQLYFFSALRTLLFPTLLYLALLYFLTPLRSTHSIGLIHVHIRSFGLEQACNGGPCGGLSLRD